MPRDFDELIFESISRTINAPNFGTKPVGDTSRTNLSWWFPKLVAAGLPVPKTRFLSLGNTIQFGEVLEGGDSKLLHLVGDLLAQWATEEIGYPCFLRSGYYSGKHRWKHTCYVTKPEDMTRHMFNIAEMSEMNMIMEPDTLSTWVIREMLPVQPAMICTGYGDMPVVSELRCFVLDDKVVSCNPYWPEDAVEEGKPDCEDWRERLAKLNDGEALMADAGEVLNLASRAGAACGGKWSVDILLTDRGWYITDMAEAEKSYGYNPDQYERKASDES